MCNVLKISSSGYYAWLKRAPCKQVKRRELLMQKIQEIYRASRGRYGSPRITAELNAQGICASQPLTAKLMRAMHLRSIVKKKFRVTTDSSHPYAVAENKLNRAFKAAEPNTAWVSDITYLRSKEGWSYLTTVIDLFDRKVIGWALSETMQTSKTIIPALHMATINRPVNKNKTLIFHSDRGIQYACDEFREEIEKHKNIVRSMSRKGNCWDNAVAESFFKTLKTELIYQNKYETKKEVALSVFEYIETWYNQKRRHKHLNNLTIFEYEQLFINQLKKAA